MCGLHLRARRLRGRAEFVAWSLEAQTVHVHDASLALLDTQDVAGLVGEDDGLLVGQVEVVEDRVEGGAPVRLVFLVTTNPGLEMDANGIDTKDGYVRRRGQC